MNMLLNTLRLTALSKQLLQSQVSFNGTFHHTLRSISGHSHLRVAVSIEQCEKALEVLTTFVGNRHTTTIVLEKRRADIAGRVIRFIESAANGETAYDLLEFSEEQLVTDMERDLRRAIRAGRGTWQLDADELEPTLRISRTSRGFSAEIELGKAFSGVTLPLDSQRAYALLADTMSRFLQSYRASLAAAA
ncbi:hypothetical protein [Pseudomonas sp. MGal98]|uniref:hypothetical protein n=1 Tax=Pseudomonas sp. MGal98 TaxID=3162460 RepID=UPI0032EDC862